MAKRTSLLDDMAFREAMDQFDVPTLFRPLPAGQPHWIYERPVVRSHPIATACHALQTVVISLVVGLGAIGAALYVQDCLLDLMR